MLLICLAKDMEDAPRLLEPPRGPPSPFAFLADFGKLADVRHNELRNRFR